MALPLVTYVGYQTRNLTGTRGEYDSYKFIQALKGREIRGWASVRMLGTVRRLENRNRADAASWFGELAGQTIRATVSPPRVFVPVPNSDCLVGVAHSRTSALARAVLPFAGGVIWDGLRWREVNAPSRQGGTRDAAELYANLRVVSRPRAGFCILIDDVTTTGGHFKAAAAVLGAIGMPPVLAVAAGQTIHEPVDDHFLRVDSVLDDFSP